MSCSGGGAVERDWTRGYLAARRFLRAHNHLRIPLDARDEHDHGHPIGQWAAVQRKQYAAGRLDTQRTRALVMLGMVWSHPDAAFDDGLTTARRYLRCVGHLAAPQNAVQDGVRVGQWLANQRRVGVMDGHPERVAALDALDRWWRPDGWTIAWQRAANETRLHLARGGTLDELVPGYTAGGEDMMVVWSVPTGLARGYSWSCFGLPRASVIVLVSVPTAVARVRGPNDRVETWIATELPDGFPSEWGAAPRGYNGRARYIA